MQYSTEATKCAVHKSTSRLHGYQSLSSVRIK